MIDAVAYAEDTKRHSPFLTTAQAAFYLGLVQETLEKMRQHRKGPRFRRHGRYIRYHFADLDAWSEANSSDAPPSAKGFG
jgi:excisionase family DNA binding protein